MSIDSGIQTRIYRAAFLLFAEKGGIDITVSELAQKAGLARGTIYNHLSSTQTLFEEVATQLTREMTEFVLKATKDESDPARRLSIGIRLFLKKSHDEPDWGKFLIRFGLSSGTLKALWEGPLVEDLQNGIKSGKFKVGSDQTASVLTLIGASTLGSMSLVREGTKTWKDASAEIVELILKALGVPLVEAKKLARKQY